MDEFSIIRITKLISNFKKLHGHDISEYDLRTSHVESADIAELVRRGIVDKYKVTNAKGGIENRYKIHRDWRTLRDP